MPFYTLVMHDVLLSHVQPSAWPNTVSDFTAVLKLLFLQIVKRFVAVVKL